MITLFLLLWNFGLILLVKVVKNELGWDQISIWGVILENGIFKSESHGHCEPCRHHIVLTIITLMRVTKFRMKSRVVNAKNKTRVV